MDAGVEAELIFLLIYQLWMVLTMPVEFMTDAGHEQNNFLIAQEERYRQNITGAMIITYQR